MVRKRIVSKKQHTFALQKQSNDSTIFASTLSEAMIIKRDHYVEALLDKRWNGKVKIITFKATFLGLPFFERKYVILLRIKSSFDEMTVYHWLKNKKNQKNGFPIIYFPGKW